MTASAAAVARTRAEIAAGETTVALPDELTAHVVITNPAIAIAIAIENRASGLPSA